MRAEQIFQFLWFRTLSLDEKLEATEALCDCVNMFKEMRLRRDLPWTDPQ